MKIKDREQNNPSATLGLADLDVAKSAVLGSLRSPGSRRFRAAFPERTFGPYAKRQAFFAGVLPYPFN